MATTQELIDDKTPATAPPPRVAVFGFYDDPEKILRNTGRPDDWQLGACFTVEALRQMADELERATPEELEAELARMSECFDYANRAPETP